MNNQYKLEELEEKIEYYFHKKELLKQALTHSSFSNEQKIYRLKNYERLEFLGDAVLELITSERLFKEKENMPEGEMTKLRATYVCEKALAYCAKEIEIGKYLFLGKGEEATGGRERASIIADVMEAIIGAIFLDAGLDAAKQFIDRFVLKNVEDKSAFYDSKTLLQETVQGEINGSVTYATMKEEGPDHNKKFVVEVYINEVKAGEGIGKTKKEAEQQAACHALKNWEKNK